MNNINENNIDKFEKEIATIFKRLRSVDEKEYLKVMTMIEFYKNKYFVMTHRPKKTFREYLK